MNPDLLYNPAYKMILLADEVEKIKLRQGKVDDTASVFMDNILINENTLCVGPYSSNYDQPTRKVLLDNGCVSIGLDSSSGARTTEAVAIGTNASSIAPQSISLGTASSVEEVAEHSIAVGYGASVTNTNSIAIGPNASANATYSVSIGTASSVGNDCANSVAVGLDAGANNTNSIAIGNNAKANAENSIAIGTNSATGSITMSEKGSIAIGHNAVALEEAIAIGKNTHAGNYMIRIGTSQTLIRLGELIIELDTTEHIVKILGVSGGEDTEDGPAVIEPWSYTNEIHIGQNKIKFTADAVIFTNGSNGNAGAVALTN